MRISKRFLWLVNSVSLAFPSFLAAQEEEDQEQEQEGTGVHYLEEIHVTGVLRERSADELAQSIFSHSRTDARTNCPRQPG